MQLLQCEQVGEVQGQQLKATLLGPLDGLGRRERHVAAGQGVLAGDLLDRNMADQDAILFLNAYNPSTTNPIAIL